MNNLNIIVYKVSRSHSFKMEMIGLNFPLLLSMICLNFMRRGDGALCYLAQTLFYLSRVTVWGVIQNSLMSLGGQEENVSNKENCPGPTMTL